MKFAFFTHNSWKTFALGQLAAPFVCHMQWPMTTIISADWQRWHDSCWHFLLFCLYLRFDLQRLAARFFFSAGLSSAPWGTQLILAWTASKKDGQAWAYLPPHNLLCTESKPEQRLNQKHGKEACGTTFWIFLGCGTRQWAHLTNPRPPPPVKELKRTMRDGQVTVTFLFYPTVQLLFLAVVCQQICCVTT